jgi:hypothetical protein
VIRTAAMGSVLAIVPAQVSVGGRCMHRASKRHTRHVAIRLVLGRLGVWDDCSRGLAHVTWGLAWGRGDSDGMATGDHGSWGGGTH